MTRALPVRFFAGDWDLPPHLNHLLETGVFMGLIWPVDISPRGPTLAYGGTPKAILPNGTVLSSMKDFETAFPDTHTDIKAALCEWMFAPHWSACPAGWAWNAPHRKNLEDQPHEMVVTVLAHGWGWLRSTDATTLNLREDKGEDVIWALQDGEHAEALKTLVTTAPSLDSLGILVLPERLKTDHAHACLSVHEHMGETLSTLRRHGQAWGDKTTQTLFTLMDRGLINVPTPTDLHNSATVFGNR